jgi:ABC-type nickel/cobalt efflux system permease component RcnA
VLPEDLYPWLNLVSGLLVLGVGASIVRARVRRARTHTHHEHDHDHDHPHDHDHDHGHGHHDHDDLRPRALLAMGASAGLIPCPSALVVLLGAVAQHQIGLGLILIVAFSAGLAATLTGLGLLVVAAGRVSTRVSGARAGRVLAVLPALSAIAIVAVGAALTAQAVPKVL